MSTKKKIWGITTPRADFPPLENPWGVFLFSLSLLRIHIPSLGFVLPVPADPSNLFSGRRSLASSVIIISDNPTNCVVRGIPLFQLGNRNLDDSVRRGTVSQRQNLLADTVAAPLRYDADPKVVVNTTTYQSVFFLYLLADIPYLFGKKGNNELTHMARPTNT